MERRKYSRTDVTVEIDICHYLGECFGQIRDLSPRSLYVEVLHGRHPDVGSPIHLNFRIWTGQCHLSRQARGEVVRADEQGIAITFAESDIVAQAVIAEIRFYIHMSEFQGHLLPQPDAA